MQLSSSSACRGQAAQAEAHQLEASSPESPLALNVRVLLVGFAGSGKTSFAQAVVSPAPATPDDAPEPPSTSRTQARLPPCSLRLVWLFVVQQTLLVSQARAVCERSSFTSPPGRQGLFDLPWHQQQ
jgi:hypothetical protein